jgi:hypothetical protein
MPHPPFGCPRADSLFYFPLYLTVLPSHPNLLVTALKQPILSCLCLAVLFGLACTHLVRVTLFSFPGYLHIQAAEWPFVPIYSEGQPRAEFVRTSADAPALRKMTFSSPSTAIHSRASRSENGAKSGSSTPQYPATASPPKKPSPKACKPPTPSLPAPRNPTT